MPPPHLLTVFFLWWFSPTALVSSEPASLRFGGLKHNYNAQPHSSLISSLFPSIQEHMEWCLSAGIR